MTAASEGAPLSWYCTGCGFAAGEAGACPRDGTALARISPQDVLGRTVGRYRLLARLGGGAFGTVYRAAHLETGALVALKLLARPIEHAESQRVVIEARAASKIAHPSCVDVHELALTRDRRPYIVMQLLEGVPLSEVIRERLSVDEALTLIGDVLRGLQAAHAQGVVHRDLKPGNIIVSAPGTQAPRAIVVDFGFAKLISDPKSPNLSITGEMIGTPAFMAPEQIRPAGRTIDGRADLYAAGVVLYQMLAQRLPFPHKQTLKVLAAHLEEPPPPIARLRPDVPPRVAAAIHRALAKHPDDRFPSAEAMLAALTVPPSRAGPIFAACALACVIVIALARC